MLLFLVTVPRNKENRQKPYIFAIFERSDFAKESGPKTLKKMEQYKNSFSKMTFLFSILLLDMVGGWPDFLFYFNN